MLWSGKQRSFVIEAFFKNAEYVTATQRAFRTRFDLNPNESFPDRKTILNWLYNLKATGFAMPKKRVEHPKSVRTPENIAGKTSVIFFKKVVLQLLCLPTDTARCWKTFYARKLKSTKILMPS
jgi:hypothetical protein